MLPVESDIVKLCKEQGLTKEQCAYVLATTYHETAGTMEPVKEAYWLSEEWRKRKLRYYPWYGRGYVQITWKENYKKAGDKLGLDLLTDPDAVLDKDTSAKILVRGMNEGWFTGKSLKDFTSEDGVDYIGARRIVNGTDKDTLIAGYAKEYESLLGDYDKEDFWGCIKERVGKVFGWKKT